MTLALLSPDDPMLQLSMPAFTGKPRDLYNVARDMFVIMRTKNGIGLAAPQVGIRTQMFVINLRGKVERFKDAYVCINPKILAVAGGPVEGEEGCLSKPGVFVKVKRFPSIKAEWTDLRGRTRYEEMHGLLARCYQHEWEHLAGVTIFSDTRRSSVGDYVKLLGETNENRSRDAGQITVNAA